MEDREKALAYYAALPREGYSGRCEMLLPDDLAGRRVLDLGCRGGKGACKLAERVGEGGFVLGVDPSPAFVERARALAARKRTAGEAWAGRLAFACALFEDLAPAGVEEASFDLVFANSVLNLAWDLQAALESAVRALKPGGFLHLAGVFADEALPADEARALAAQGNVFGAARTLEEFERMARQAGFASCELIERRPATPDGSDALPQHEGRAFTAAVVRATR
ncbi:class I SAM-dependent methyltransferase [Arabiibacter massiliensis]|uniref:class I SAM-dependent methyltransferase n=1 Tax=Arabiibacter massiliensis TaxID=1870985 RepID=UPI0009BB41F4|nr:methyltransferase domain-containing protein [Arabiibacter massiliensis]